MTIQSIDSKRIAGDGLHPKPITVVCMILQMMYVNNVRAEFQTEVSVEDSMCEVKHYMNNMSDKKPALAFQMTTQKHSSGVAYAINFELSNNTDHNVSVAVKQKIIESILIGILLSKANGIYIAEPRIRSDDKEQPTEMIHINSGGKQEWSVSLKGILKTSDIIKKELINGSKGILMVYFSFDYILTDNGCEKIIKKGKFTLGQDGLFSLASYSTPAR